jgi:pimeloyl-ACP methyl ester carboxylesterase
MASSGRERQQEIGFLESADGVRIAFASVGSGAPLVKTANWLNHLEHDWRSPIWRHWLDALCRDHRLIRYDARGNGLSDREVEEISLEAFVRDLEAVVDGLGLERFPLLGISQGCAVSIAYAVRHPERVSHLVLFGGFARGWARSDPAEYEKHAAMQTLIRQGWGKQNPAFRQVFTSLFVPGATSEQMDWFNEMQSVSASPENAARIRDACRLMDVEALLPRVTTPTLVLHCRDDAVVLFEVGRSMAAGIPGARFVPLEGRNHLLLEEEPRPTPSPQPIQVGPRSIGSSTRRSISPPKSVGAGSTRRVGVTPRSRRRCSGCSMLAGTRTS